MKTDGMYILYFFSESAFITFKLTSFFRFKGKAYIIVDGKRDAAIDTLAHVLAKTDNILMGRRIRIEIYQVSFTCT